MLLLRNKEQQQNNALESFVTFWVCRRRSGYEWTASSSLHHTRTVKLGSFGFAASFLRKSSAWNCFHLFVTIRAWLITQQWWSQQWRTQANLSQFICTRKLVSCINTSSVLALVQYECHAGK